MPEIAAAQTAADMTYAKPHAFLPTGAPLVCKPPRCAGLCALPPC